jgi:hypothetical protein
VIDSGQIERFTLKCAAIHADLNNVLSENDVSYRRSALEEATDALIERHLNGSRLRTRTAADRMAEFYKLFYILENEIRDFVSSILEEAKGEGWWDAAVPDEVRKSASNNKARESKEGLPPRSSEMIDYTTFGHLGEIIKNNWDAFAGYFPNAGIERLEKVVSRLNLARGPIAHCGYLPEDEVVRLKLAIRDWFALQE